MMFKRITGNQEDFIFFKFFTDPRKKRDHFISRQGAKKDIVKRHTNRFLSSVYIRQVSYLLI